MKCSIFILVLLLGAAKGQGIVINGVPTRAVYNEVDSTWREDYMSAIESASKELLIKKSNGSYLWASRQNRKLNYFLSGAVHIFIEDTGAGYISVIDVDLVEGKNDTGRRFLYKEHIRSFMGDVTYWGKVKAFEP